METVVIQNKSLTHHPTKDALPPHSTLICVLTHGVNPKAHNT